ncbi:hypothetical protein J3E64_003152 [Sphingobium sp. OAS761]|uniref:DUF2336 domain-containing protein n=1 Tax=Sphingobium sp. OAS761 TaxID=2817901 RepID=UPI00209CF6A3|nr:DUF2336 domain-containing protein [Sphingobium sp. OAS761]MCP1471445.1 hypothetical protein [Sphingobium sp. OAS761]
MNAFSCLAGTTMADSWPMARVMAGMSAMPVAHAIDLALFFEVDERARHDALIAETRRHIGGCIAAIETAMRVSLDHEPTVTTALKSSPEPLCWATIRAQPSLVSPALLAHMQVRAGLSLMLRQFGQRDVESAGEEDIEWLPRPDDPEAGEAMTALGLAEARWIAPGGDAQPMRPDLPAEEFAELVWTVAACLAIGASRAVGMPADGMIVAFERSGMALLADHDESVSPIIQAERLVRRMGARADAPELLGKALGGRRFLIFAALTARRLRMSVQQVVEILIAGPMPQVAALCRALGGSDADYRHLLLALRPVRPALSDPAVVAEAERYGALEEQAADMTVSALRAPAALRNKIDHLLRASAR